LPEIIGIGTDLEETSRFHKHIAEDRSVSSLINDLFTPEEISRNLSYKNPYLCFTLGFSCKESVFKALGISWMNAPVTWKEIECLYQNDPAGGEPEIRLSGEALKMFLQRGGKKIDSESEVKKDHVVFRVIMWK
jgi:phosphopantetheine--protein transferase-like protein